jgi:hypothetical protein
MWACYLGNVGVVEALLESGADVSLQENNGNHALTAGVVCTSADLAHAFQVMDLVLGQNPDHRMLEDAFSNSVIYGRIEIFRFLLGIVGDVNYANRSSGRLTPLLQAIARGTAYRVGALLCHGADYTLKDVCGQNILLYLGKFGNWPMIQLFQCLELSGLDPNAISVDKETAQDLIDKRTDVTDKFKKEYRKLLDDCESRKGETPATFELSKTTLSKIMDIMDRYPDNLVAWNSAPAKK